MRQAREDRRLPGEGGLDLDGLLNAMPGDFPISLELPLAGGMEPGERAKVAVESFCLTPMEG